MSSEPEAASQAATLAALRSGTTSTGWGVARSIMRVP